MPSKNGHLGISMPGYFHSVLPVQNSGRYLGSTDLICHLSFVICHAEPIYA
jgi:hypothetical protein